MSVVKLFKNLRPLFLVGTTFLSVHAVFADDLDSKSAADKIQEDKKRAHLMSNIDIFGKTDLPAIYILMPNSTGDDDIKGSLLTRDFSRDDFFMQNVDREEFELKVTLREIGEDDSKKKDEDKR